MVPVIKTYGVPKWERECGECSPPPCRNIISIGGNYKLDAFKIGSLGTNTQILIGNGINDTPIWVETEVPIAVGNTEKRTGIDAGILHERSVTNDYEYICVQGGNVGTAIWKKKPLIAT